MDSPSPYRPLPFLKPRHANIVRGERTNDREEGVEDSNENSRYPIGVLDENKDIADEDELIDIPKTIRADCGEAVVHIATAVSSSRDKRVAEVLNHQQAGPDHVFVKAHFSPKGL